MASDHSSEVLIDVRDGVGTLTINRPQVRNALTPAYLLEFTAAVKRLEADEAVRVLVVTGAGKAFSSGAEMSFLKDIVSMTAAEVQTVVYASFQGAAKALKLCSKPVIAAVNGPAVGAGCELAVACDFRVVARDAFFCENWIELGIIPPLGGMFLLPRLIGLERASNMMMRATRVYGDEALAIGLASEVADTEQFPEAVRKFAADLAARPRLALSILKQGLRRGQESSLASEWDFNVQAQSMLLKGTEFNRAVDAIHAGQKPTYP